MNRRTSRSTSGEQQELGRKGNKPIEKKIGPFYVSGKPPTYPYPQPTLTLTSHLGQNAGLEEG